MFTSCMKTEKKCFLYFLFSAEYYQVLCRINPKFNITVEKSYFRKMTNVYGYCIKNLRKICGLF